MLGKNYWYIKDPTTLPAILMECYSCKAVAMDVETTRRRDLPKDLVFNEHVFQPGLDPYVSEVRLLQLATPTNIYVIDLWHCPDIEMFRDLFMHEGILKIGQNLKFDIKMLMRQFGFDFRHIFDTMLASQLLTNGLHEFYMKHSLHDIALRELGVELDKTMQVSDWGQYELSEEQILYAARDVDVLHDICLSLAAKMRPKNFIIDTVTGQTLDLFPVMKIENDACIATARMELDGVYVDKDLWNEFDLDIRARYLDVAARIKGELGDINLESPQQLKKALAAMGVTVQSTDADTLEILAKTLPIAALLSEYRSLAKLLSSYGNGIPGKARRKVKGKESVYFIERINPVSGRIHSSFGQLYTDTGRYQSDKPNVENVVGMDKAPFRRAFMGQTINGVKNEFVIADLEQFETRALCALSGDKNLLSVILDKTTDTHTRTAAMMYGVPEDTIVSRDPVTRHKVPGPNAWMRAAAKSIAFGLAYGRGPKSLAEQLGISLVEARRAIQLYFATYPSIHAWLNKAAYSARTNRYSLDPMNRIRWYEFDPNNHKDVASVERCGKNMPIQSVNADVIKLALFYVHCEFPLGGPVKVVNCIHDEINVECPPDMAGYVTAKTKELMERAGNEIIKTVPILADADHGSDWSIK